MNDFGATECLENLIGRDLDEERWVSKCVRAIYEETRRKIAKQGNRALREKISGLREKREDGSISIDELRELRRIEKNISLGYERMSEEKKKRSLWGQEVIYLPESVRMSVGDLFLSYSIAPRFRYNKKIRFHEIKEDLLCNIECGSKLEKEIRNISGPQFSNYIKRRSADYSPVTGITQIGY